MERAGRVVSKLKLAKHGVTDEQMAQAAWPLAVGKRIASHCGGVSLVRSRLVIEVEDQVWQRQLFTLRNQVLAKLESVLGRRIIDELEFRVGVPRRMPARAGSNLRAADEADSIADPIFRSLYKTARRKASA